MRPLILYALFTLACSPVVGPTISASDYDQTCQRDDDCALVKEGEVCSCASCMGNAAVNKSDEAAFNQKRQQLKRACGPPTPCAAMCAYSETFCAQGKCSVRHLPLSDGGTPGDAGGADAS